MSEGLGYSRLHLRALSETRFEDATTLFDAGRYSAAYYLGGYAIELGLKACIARQFRADTIPDPSLAQKVYVHDFAKLVNLAGLGGHLSQKKRFDPIFAGHWGVTSQWSEAARYDEWDRFTVHQFLTSIGDSEHGVHQWLKLYW